MGCIAPKKGVVSVSVTVTVTVNYTYSSVSEQQASSVCT